MNKWLTKHMRVNVNDRGTCTFNLEESWLGWIHVLQQ